MSQEREKPMPEGEVKAWLEENLPKWRLEDDWIRRTYKTASWKSTLMVVNTIGHLAEAAWHHPDLELGYAQVIVKIQTHRVLAITESDVALARRIDEVALWKPGKESPLEGFPKNWVR